MRNQKIIQINFKNLFKEKIPKPLINGIITLIQIIKVSVKHPKKYKKLAKSNK